MNCKISISGRSKSTHHLQVYPTDAQQQQPQYQSNFLHPQQQQQQNMYQQHPNQFGSQQYYQGGNQPTDDEYLQRGDESLPWRRPKSSRIRSRSLQPRERNIDDYPWLRQRRDRSVPKQETFLHGKYREPIRPWIEEVICLKKAQIKRKIIEHEQLETVFLKASQIERREIIREQLQKIDLKSVQKYFEKANMTNILEEIQESLLTGEIDDSKLQQLKQVEEISILELTRQIDELVKKDTHSRGEIKDQKIQRIGKSEEISFNQTLTNVDDTVVMRLDRQNVNDLRQIQQQEVAVPWERGRKRLVDRSRQAVSHTEQSTLLKLDQSLEVQSKRLEQMEQEQPVAWRRGGRPQGGTLSHVEDSNILNVNQSTSKVESQQIIEQAVAWRRGPKKPEETTLSYIEDSNMLNIDQYNNVLQEQQMQQMIEQPVAWRRGPKQPEPVQSHVEDSNMLTIDQYNNFIQEQQTQQMIEQPVAWRRGPKQPEPVQSYVEDTNILTIDTAQEVEHMDETPVAWRRGKQPQQQSTQQPTEPEIPQEVEKTLPWMRGKKQKPKEKEPAVEQVQLKPIPRKPSVPKHQEESVELITTQQVEEIQPDTVEEPEPQQQTEVAVPWRRGGKKQKPVEVVEEPTQEIMEEEIEEEEILEQPHQKSVKPKKKISKKKKLKHTESESVEEIPDEDTPVNQLTETIVPDEVTETVATNEPVKQFILKEVKETKEVVEKKKVKVIKLDTPEENVEDIPVDEMPIAEEAQTVDEPDNIQSATIEKVDVKKKKIIVVKKKVKKQKSVAFNDELQTFEAEQVDDENLVEESQTSIQLKQGEVKPVMVDDDEEIEELEYDDDEFKKEIAVKMTSNIIKKNKKRIHIDDSQPLPELELITQKRVQEVIDKVAEEEVIEDQLIKEVDETVSNVTLPEKKLVKTKPAVIKPPRFIKKLQPALCQPDKPAVLQCKIDGSPYPIIKWYFNDHELFASEKYIMNVVEKVATLEIARVTPMDVGIYICQAKNEAGVATSRTNLALGKFAFQSNDNLPIFFSLLKFCLLNFFK